MEFHKEYLDLILVPSGLLLMFTYHLFLLYKYLHHWESTAIGFENHDRKAWVQRIMQAENRDVKAALSVIQSNTSAATFLATVSLTLCSIIGAWVANTSNNFLRGKFVYGDTRSSTLSIKYITLLSCFLLAFSFFVQSARHFVHANYLVSIPDCAIPVSSVETAVIRGSNFWLLGLRSLYFALNLLLWFFGPIPMFVSSVVLAGILFCHDYNSRPLHEYRSSGTKYQQPKGIIRHSNS